VTPDREPLDVLDDWMHQRIGRLRQAYPGVWPGTTTSRSMERRITASFQAANGGALHVRKTPVPTRKLQRSTPPSGWNPNPAVSKSVCFDPNATCDSRRVVPYAKIIVRTSLIIQMNVLAATKMG
jgi:hypothetical protein